MLFGSIGRIKEVSMSKEKRVLNYDLRITKSELIHVRDLLSVKVPNDEDMTISEMIAKSEIREEADIQLWKKIVKLCKEANVAVEDEAPDYTIGITSTPKMYVFRVQNEDELYEEEHDENPKEDNVERILLNEQVEEEDGEQISCGPNIVCSPKQTNESDTMPNSGGNDKKDTKRKHNKLYDINGKKRPNKRAKRS